MVVGRGREGKSLRAARRRFYRRTAAGSEACSYEPLYLFTRHKLREQFRHRAEITRAQENRFAIGSN